MAQTSLLSRAVRGGLLALYRRQGWHAVGTPPPGRKCVIIAAPHTSNWDFVNFLGLTADLGIRPRFMAKDSLFRWPLGRFMAEMGGVADNRAQRSAYVEAMAAEFARNDDFMLVLAPEGTRGPVARWRTGFYHIALAAGVPLVCGFMDYATRTGGLGPSFMPTGDYAADMAQAAAFYNAVTPKHPERGSTSLAAMLGEG